MNYQSIKNELDENTLTQEGRYYNVEFLGKKQVLQNPADGRFYVRVGNGQMISYEEITGQGMCRACEQFQTSGQADTIVYVYSVHKSDRKWFNEPIMFFSKKPDIVLEEVCSTPVKQ